MNHDDVTSRCNRPTCPSCWLQKNDDLYRHLERVEDIPYFFIRSSCWLELKEEPDPGVFTALFRRGYAYKTLGKSVTFQELDGRVQYKILGAFSSVTPGCTPEEYVSMGGGSVTAVGTYGVVERQVFEYRQDFLEAWVDQLNPIWPAYYRASKNVIEAVSGESLTVFNNRHWTRKGRR